MEQEAIATLVLVCLPLAPHIEPNASCIGGTITASSVKHCTIHPNLGRIKDGATGARFDPASFSGTENGLETWQKS